MLSPVLIMEESLHDQPVVKTSPTPRTVVKPCLRQVRTWEAHGNGPCKLPRVFQAWRVLPTPMRVLSCTKNTNTRNDTL
jgi:hypothetical protein